MNEGRELYQLPLRELVWAIQDTEELLGPDADSTCILKRELVRREALLAEIQAVKRDRRCKLAREDIPITSSFAGRFAWTDSDVRALAQCLGLRAPLGGDEPEHESTCPSERPSNSRGHEK